MKDLIIIVTTISILGLTSASVSPAVSIKPASISSNHCEIFSEEHVSQERAQEIGQFYEKAYIGVGEDLGAYPSKKMKIYVYNSQKSLVQGLVRFNGFSYDSAKFFAKGGAPRPWNYTIHVPPHKDLSFIVHEYTHCVIEELSGKAYMSIKWLDEGLAEFEAYKLAQKERHWSCFLVKSSIESGDFIPLKKISSGQQWHNIRRTKRTLMYSEALIAVDFFIKKYGIKNGVQVLKLVNKNYSQNKALKKTIGTNLKQFEKHMKSWIIQVKNIHSMYAIKPTDEGTIRIDGFSQDWKNINPIVADPVKDVKSKIRGTDIKNVYLFQGENFLYVMFESYPSDSGKADTISYTFYIDDNAESKKFNIRYQPGADSTGRTWFWHFPGETNYKDITKSHHIKKMKAGWGIKTDGTQILEMKIPVSSIGYLEKFKCCFGTFVRGKRTDLTKKIIYSK